MFRNLVLLGLTLGVVQAYALPQAADKLVQGVAVQSEDFADFLADHAGNGFRTNYDSVSVETVTGTQALRKQCDQFSKSAGFVSVSLKKQGKVVKKRYYSTSRLAENLVPCADGEGSEYRCPAPGSVINCFPGGNQPAECAPKYRSWIEKNCERVSFLD